MTVAVRRAASVGDSMGQLLAGRGDAEHGRQHERNAAQGHTAGRDRGTRGHAHRLGIVPKAVRTVNRGVQRPNAAGYPTSRRLTSPYRGGGETQEARPGLPGRASGARRVSTTDLDLAPCSSSAALILSASSLAMPSLIGLGDASTRSWPPETQAGQLTHDLDDRDLVGADLGQHGAELGLLLDDRPARRGLVQQQQQPPRVRPP